MSKRNSVPRGGSRANRAAAQKSKKMTAVSNHFKSEGGIFSLIYENNYEVDSSDGDGNCLFRSLSTSLTGSENYHLKIRSIITAELSRAIPKARINQAEIEEQDRKDAKNGKSNSSLYQDEEEIVGGRRTRRGKEERPKMKFGKDNDASLIAHDLAIPDYHYFVLGDFEDYCKRMSGSAIWGGHLELQAAANIFGVKIVVLQDRFPPILVNPDAALWPNPPTLSMYVIYRGGCHYDAILPTDERRDEFQHLQTQLKTQSSSIQARHGKLLSDFPLNLELVEPLKQSWLLSPDGLAKSREAGDEAKKRDQKRAKSKWDFYDSQDDADNDEDDPLDDAKRVARPTNSGDDNGTGMGDDIQGDGVGANRGIELKIKSSDIPTLKFVFWGVGHENDVAGSKPKTKTSKSGKSTKSSKLREALLSNLDDSAGFDSFMGDVLNDLDATAKKNENSLGDDMKEEGDENDQNDDQDDPSELAEPAPTADELQQLIDQIDNIDLNEELVSNTTNMDESQTQNDEIDENDWEKFIPKLIFQFEPKEKKKSTSSRGSKAKIVVARRSSARLKEKKAAKDAKN